MSSRLLWAVALVALAAPAALAAEPPPPVLYERPKQLVAPTTYPPPIEVLAPHREDGRIMWLPDGWKVTRLGPGAVEAAGPGQAVVQMEIHTSKDASDRWLRRICKVSKKKTAAFSEAWQRTADRVCTDGVVARRETGLAADGTRVTATGVMVDVALVRRLARLTAFGLGLGEATPGAAAAVGPGKVLEVRAPARVALPGLGWAADLPADEPDHRGVGTRYAVASWGESGGRAALIAKRTAYRAGGEDYVGGARAVVAVTAASTPCPAPYEPDAYAAIVGNDLDGVVSLVAKPIFTGHEDRLELCVPISPGSVWLGISHAGGQPGSLGSSGSVALELGPLVREVFRALLRGAIADATAASPPVYGAAPDRDGRLVSREAFDAAFPSPSERDRARAAARRPPPARSNCRELIVTIVIGGSGGLPHACTGTRDEQLAFTEAWYARRGAEGWPGVYGFGSYASRIGDRPALAGELALIDALVTLARSGGTSDATALAAFGRAIARIGADHPELDRHEQIVAWGQALATPGGAPGGGDPAAPSVRQLVDETNRRVDAYFDGLSRVGHGCSSTAACAEQAKRDARAAIERRR